MGLISRLREKYSKNKDMNNQVFSNGVFAVKGRILNKKLNTENILKLTDSNGQIEYFYMEYTPTTVLLVLQTGRKELKCTFKQLTGKNVGKDFEITYPRTNTCDGCFSFNEQDIRTLRIQVKGFGNKYLDVLATNEFEEYFGRKVSLRELLELYNIETNNQNSNVR